MAETTADVRRDIEQTRERMFTTLTELEQRLNVMQVVRDHPWPVLALAFGAGLALSATGSDAKAAAATVAATKGSRTKIGAALDDIVANMMTGVHGALQDRIDGWVDELKSAIGAPRGTSTARRRPGMVATSGGYGVGPTSSDLTNVQPGRAD
ncbi:MAG TPA: DUF3618 domain-containing protein [Gemmatimonadaceae bacterium]